MIPSGKHPASASGLALERWLPAAILCVVVALAHHRAAQGVWVFDDFSSVVENPSLRQLWPPDVLLNPPADAGTAGRPVANISLALNYALSGLNPWGYRLANIALHAANTLLLFAVIRRTLRVSRVPTFFAARADAIALTAAAVWAAHPLTTAVIGYVAQRTEALMAFFFLGTFYSFLRTAESKAPKLRWKIAALVLCALGMASKETMVTAPVWIATFDVVFVAGSWREAWRTRGKLHLALAATWLVLLALLLTSEPAERGVGFDQGVTAVDYLRLQALALLTYLKLALWPHPLVFDRGWIATPDAITTALAASACLLVFIATWRLWRTHRRAGFMVASCFLLLLPTTSFVPIVQQPMAENRMYLPLAALIAVAAASLFAALPFRTLRVAALALVAGLSVASNVRNALFRDEVLLWRDNIAKTPDNARALANLAAALLRADRPAEARVPATRALALRPDYAEAHGNLALALAATGELPLALEHYDHAIRLRPRWVVPRYNRGIALFQLGRMPEAADAFRATLALDPAHARAHTNLAVAARALGRHDASLRHAQRAVDLDPTLAEAHYNLGNALADAARPAEAIEHFTRALELQPNFPRAHNNLGVLFLRRGDRTRALQHFDAALALKPDYAEARRNRAHAAAH